MSQKRIRNTLYLESKIRVTAHKISAEVNSEGYLFSDGRYATKILPEDLPEWFVYGYIYKRHGYISAKGVKHLLYVPNYLFDNHLHKDDLLFISYNEEIESFKNEDGFIWYNGYDHLVYGSFIVPFVEAAQKYSGYDVNEIQKEIARKREWYFERNPEQKGGGVQGN